MTEQPKEGFYIGTFHNDDHKYIDEIKATGEPEIFEVSLEYNPEVVCYRLNDSFAYQFENFIDPVLLDNSGIVESETIYPAKENSWYWILNITMKESPEMFYAWEPVYVVSINNKLRFKRLGQKGLLSLAYVEKIGPMINLMSQE